MLSWGGQPRFPVNDEDWLRHRRSPAWQHPPRRQPRRVRLARLALWLARQAGRAVGVALVLVWLLADAVWAGLRARPGPALVAGALTAVAFVTAWVVR